MIKIRGIFTKILIVFLIISIIPTIVSDFLTTISYQSFIEKYITEVEEEPVQSELAMLQQNLMIQGGLTLFLIIILITFASIFIARGITNPLRELVEKTKEVTTGKLDVKIEAKTRDELAELIESFNKMAEDLKEAKTVLEIKVEARTRELKELAEKQEELVGQKTTELQEKVEELERFNKLAVGRELKMIELKKEIEKLKKELEKPKGPMNN